MQDGQQGAKDRDGKQEGKTEFGGNQAVQLHRRQRRQVENTDAHTLQNQRVIPTALAQEPPQAEQSGAREGNAGVAQFDRKADVLGGKAEQEGQPEEENQHADLHQRIDAVEQIAHRLGEAVLERNGRLAWAAAGYRRFGWRARYGLCAAVPDGDRAVCGMACGCFRLLWRQSHWCRRFLLRVCVGRPWDGDRSCFACFDADRLCGRQGLRRDNVGGWRCFGCCCQLVRVVGDFGGRCVARMAFGKWCGKPVSQLCFNFLQALFKAQDLPSQVRQFRAFGAGIGAWVVRGFFAAREQMADDAAKYRKNGRRRKRLCHGADEQTGYYADIPHGLSLSPGGRMRGYASASRL